MLHLQQLERSRVDEQLDRVLVAQPVAAGDGVVEMIVQAVVVLDHAGSAALGGHRVAAHRIDLREQRDPQRRIGLDRRDRSAQAGAAGADNDDVGRDHVHWGIPAAGLKVHLEASAALK